MEEKGKWIANSRVSGVNMAVIGMNKGVNFGTTSDKIITGMMLLFYNIALPADT